MEVNNISSTSSSTDPLFMVYQFFNFTLTAIFCILAAIILIFVINRLLTKLKFWQKIKTVNPIKSHIFLLIKTPPRNQQKEDAMQALFQSLHRLLPKHSTLSLEIISANQFLNFVAVIPRNLKSLVESQIYANYPEAEIEEIPDYLPPAPDNTAITQLYFKKSSIHPIATYQEAPDNLIKNLSALTSKADTEDQIVIQLVVKRVESGLRERGFGNWYAGMRGNKTSKTVQDLYSGRIRVIYTSQNSLIAKAKLDTLINLFKSLKSLHNELTTKKMVLDSHLYQSAKARIFEKGDLWSAAEIATIYHFPYQGDLTSNVAITNSKKAPAPDILPVQGNTDPKQVSFFGVTNYRNEGKVFGIKRIDRRRHLYVVGKTGSGKSRLIQLLLISDILNGEGCCLLDPHGDLAYEILKFIPKERIEDVVYVDPTDRDFPIGFNPLERVDDYETRQHLSTFFIAIFKKLFSANWNPRMEHIIRYVTLALLETPDSNILGIQRMLSDTNFRQRVIMQIQDPVVKSFWTTEFSAWNDRFANDAVIPILNKIGQFIANPIVRNMIGQRQNVLDFESFMNQGKIVIINVSKGKLGDENAALLGSMFITKIQQAALARAKMAEEERKDFYFYVDEFQNFATDAFSSILSEARKYHLDLTIAHQYIAQLPEEVKATAFGNVGSLIVFPVGGDDAKYLAKEFAPLFTAEDMISMNVREMYIKMSIDGRVSAPFSAKTLDVPHSPYDYTVEIINQSRMKFGKNRVQVENEIARWTQTGEMTQTANKEEYPEPLI